MIGACAVHRGKRRVARSPARSRPNARTARVCGGLPAAAPAPRPTRRPRRRLPAPPGVDEAGRGPVLGPLVYGAAFCPVAFRDTLAKQAYADSKTLSEEKRDALFSALQADPRLGHLVDVTSADTISACMLRAQPHSLNAISFDSCFGLIQAALDAGVRLTEAYVDTVGDETTCARGGLRGKCAVCERQDVVGWWALLCQLSPAQRARARPCAATPAA